MAPPVAVPLIVAGIGAGASMVSAYFDREEEARQAKLNRQSNERMSTEADNTKRLNLNLQMQQHKDNLGLTKANERLVSAQSRAIETQNSAKDRLMSAYGGD